MSGFDPTNGIEINRDFNNNLTRVYLGQNITLWFSYETIVAFAVSGEGTYKIRKGRYSMTTSKHTNSIAAHELADEQFNTRLASLLSRINAAVDSVNYVEEATKPVIHISYRNFPGDVREETFTSSEEAEARITELTRTGHAVSTWDAEEATV